jgi:hypothetical protein
MNVTIRYAPSAPRKTRGFYRTSRRTMARRRGPSFSIHANNETRYEEEEFVNDPFSTKKSPTRRKGLTTPMLDSKSTSFSNCLGYLSRSSPTPNCVGLTKMDATTTSFWDRAARISERCPVRRGGGGRERGTWREKNEHEIPNSSIHPTIVPNSR